MNYVTVIGHFQRLLILDKYQRELNILLTEMVQNLNSTSLMCQKAELYEKKAELYEKSKVLLNLLFKYE